VVVLLVSVQIVITILKVVLLVGELVVMADHLHQQSKDMEGTEHSPLEVEEVVEEDKHLIQT
jgi:hypothetical protein